MRHKEKEELLNEIWALLEKWESITPSPDFKVRLRGRIEGLEAKTHYGLFRWRFVPVFASIIFILTTSIFIKTRFEKLNLVREIELYQNLEIIENMDLLAELDSMDELEEDEVS